jgi:hypothetical protein
MKHTPEQLALQHTLAMCQGHAEALQDALQDMQLRGLLAVMTRFQALADQLAIAG